MNFVLENIVIVIVLLYNFIRGGRCMYCQKCGNKCDEKSGFCPNCGAQLNNFSNVSNSNVYNTPKKGKGIASMVLGIIGLLYALMTFAAFEDLDSYLYGVPYRAAFAFGVVLVPLIFAIIAICLAVVERKNNKNGFNTAGFWLSISIFIIALIQFIYVLAY